MSYGNQRKVKGRCIYHDLPVIFIICITLFLSFMNCVYIYTCTLVFHCLLIILWWNFKQHCRSELKENYSYPNILLSKEELCPLPQDLVIFWCICIYIYTSAVILNYFCLQKWYILFHVLNFFKILIWNLYLLIICWVVFKKCLYRYVYMRDSILKLK